MARDSSSTDTVDVPFLFVPDGETPSADWLAAHPGAIRVPATFVPRDPAKRTRCGAPLADDRERPTLAGRSVRQPVPAVFRLRPGRARAKPVLRSDRTPIMRPAGLDPHMFVEAGQRDRQRLAMMLAAGANAGTMAAEILRAVVDLWKFQRGHSWDAQHVGGKYHPEFVDYATIAIELYAAAARLPRNMILDIENMVADSAHFARGTEYDEKFRNLPQNNVRNTDIGMHLYESGAIGSNPDR